MSIRHGELMKIKMLIVIDCRKAPKAKAPKAKAPQVKVTSSRGKTRTPSRKR
jgi:hypothetical protein